MLGKASSSCLDDIERWPFSALEGFTTQTLLQVRFELKKVLHIAIALVAATKLVDFLFYGRDWNDLFGALGFALLFVGSVLSGHPSDVGVRGRLAKSRQSLFGAAGLVIVILHFLVSWKVL